MEAVGGISPSLNEALITDVLWMGVMWMEFLLVFAGAKVGMSDGGNGYETIFRPYLGLFVILCIFVI